MPAALVLMAWLTPRAAQVLFNLTLLADPFGRLALRPADARAAVVSGAGIGAALAALAGGVLSGRHALVLAAIGMTFAAGAFAVGVAGWRPASGGWSPGTAARLRRTAPELPGRPAVPPR